MDAKVCNVGEVQEKSTREGTRGIERDSANQQDAILILLWKRIVSMPLHFVNYGTLSPPFG